MSLRKKTISGVKWTSVSSVAKVIIGILQISILTRFLLPSDFGLMALVTFLIGFLDLFMDMGLSSAILHKQKISKKEYSSLFWLNILFGISVFLLISGMSGFISSFYGEEELNSLIPQATITIIIASIGRQFKVIKQKKLEFKFIAITDVIGFFIGLIVSSTLAYLDFGVYALVYGLVAQMTWSNLFYFFNGIGNNGLLLWFRLEDTRPFLRIGMYQVGGQVANYLNRDLDILIIGKVFGAEVLGGYSLAKQLVQRPSRVMNPIISTVAGPVLALIQKDPAQLSRNYLKLTGYVSQLSLMSYSFLAIFSYPILYVLYGEAFVYISHLVSILCVYMFFRSIGNPIGSLLIATGRTDLDLKWNFAVLLIMPVFIIIGAQFSVEVMAIILSFSMFFLMLLSWRFIISKLISVSLQQYLKSIFSFRFKELFKALKSTLE